MAPEYRFSHTLLQTIVNCQEKVGPQKVWELLTESGKVNRQISSDHPERFHYCILINCNLCSISYEEVKRDGKGEREMPTIVHFEIPSDDIERSKKFYNGLFGWNFEKSPSSPPGIEYWLVSTADDKRNKALTGGMMKRLMPEQGPINYVDVKSVEQHSAKVEQLGGKVIFPKMAVPGWGYFAICADTENNGFAIFEADNTAK
jgi:uncharacterized protein